MYKLNEIMISNGFGKVRLNDINYLIRKIYEDIKKTKGWGSGEFCTKTLKVGRRTLYGWFRSSPINIFYFLKLLDIWKFVCKKNDFEVRSLIKLTLSKVKKFSVAKGKCITLPNKLTSDLAYIIGYTFGDGCLSGKTLIKKSQFRIRLASDTKHFLKVVIQPLFRKLFSVKGRIYNIRNCRCYEFSIQSKVLYLFFHKLFQIPQGKKKGKLRIPKIIINASNRIRCAFIAGLFDADGCIFEKDRAISFCQADKIFLTKISKLFNELNINTRPICKSEKEFGITYNFVVRANSISNFLNNIPLLHPNRIKRANKLRSIISVSNLHR